MIKHRTPLIIRLAISLILLDLAISAHAALLAYEPFNNTTGTAIIGSGGGWGFSGAWQTNSSGGVATNTGYGLAYTDAAGNALQTDGGAGYFQGLTTANTSMQPYRLFSFARGTNGTDGGTTWISFLAARKGPAISGSNPYARGANVCQDLNSGAAQKLAIGNSSGATTNTVALIPQGAGGNIKPSAVVFSQTNFIVVRINHNSGALDDAYLFVNPNLNSEPSVGSANANSIGSFDYSFDRLRVFAGGSNTTAQPYAVLLVDEYRVGETYADVAPYVDGSGTTNPPAISTQPASQAAAVGSSPGFTVLASGGIPLHYQWYFNTNSLLNNATNNTLPLSGITRTDAGKYSVIITNDFGAVTSSFAVLTVTNTPPVAATDTSFRQKDMSLNILIANLLTNDTDSDGDTLTMSGINLTTTNGVTLQTNATYIFYTNSQNVGDRFTYTVSDGFGGAVTGTVLIKVVTNITGSVQTVGVSETTASVVFVGIPGYSYEIQRSTNLVDWVTLATNIAPNNGLFGIADDFADLDGPPIQAFYRLRFAAANAGSPLITTQPQSLTLHPGQNATFSVAADGVPAPVFQWYFNTNTPLADATNSSLTITNAQTDNAGSYLVVAGNYYGTATGAVATLAFYPPPVAGAFFVSPSGNDSYPGTEASPFLTISKGLTAINSNGVLYLRGGTYAQPGKLTLNKVGATNNAIRIWAYPGEAPVIDSTGNSSDGISISGKNYHLKGFTVMLAGHNGINISGDSNRVEFCTVHDNANTGLHITGGTGGTTFPAYNLILNCDSYRNYDAPTHGQNADGFTAKWDLGPGNVFRNCRAYENADDGWDLWMGSSPVLIEGCWAFRNGSNYFGDTAWQGNGNGFKLGGNYTPTPHRLLRSVAFNNLANGVDQNNNTAGQTVDNCTAWGNAKQNFDLNHNSTNAPTTGVHTVRNNVSAAGDSSDSFSSGALLTNNSWQVLSPDANTGDFLSVAESVATAPRQADGSLPATSFLHPVPDGRLVDVGIDIGEPFNGAAPDLGAYESP